MKAVYMKERRDTKTDAYVSVLYTLIFVFPAYLNVFFFPILTHSHKHTQTHTVICGLGIWMNRVNRSFS